MYIDVVLIRDKHTIDASPRHRCKCFALSSLRVLALFPNIVSASFATIVHQVSNRFLGYLDAWA